MKNLKIRFLKTREPIYLQFFMSSDVVQIIFRMMFILKAAVIIGG